MLYHEIDIVLEDTQVPVTGLLMDTKGTTTNGDQVSIVHYPHVVLSSEASQEDVAKVQGLILKAEEQCRLQLSMTLKKH